MRVIYQITSSLMTPTEQIKDVRNIETSWVKEAIQKTYKDAGVDLTTLQSKVKSTSLKEAFSQNVTLDNVKNVLNLAVAEMKKSGNTFTTVYEKMSAGLVISVQAALQSLGYDFSKYGLDGRYKNKGQDPKASETRTAVKKFQEDWNTKHDTKLVVDGWAGEKTLEAILSSMKGNKKNETLFVPAPIKKFTPDLSIPRRQENNSRFNENNSIFKDYTPTPAESTKVEKKPISLDPIVRVPFGGIPTAPLDTKPIITKPIITQPLISHETGTGSIPLLHYEPLPEDKKVEFGANFPEAEKAKFQEVYQSDLVDYNQFILAYRDFTTKYLSQKNQQSPEFITYTKKIEEQIQKYKNRCIKDEEEGRTSSTTKITVHQSMPLEEEKKESYSLSQGMIEKYAVDARLLNKQEQNTILDDLAKQKFQEIPEEENTNTIESLSNKRDEIKANIVSLQEEMKTAEDAGYTIDPKEFLNKITVIQKEVADLKNLAGSLLDNHVMVDVYNAETGKNEMKTEKVALQLKIEGVEKYLLTVYNPAEATTPNTAQSKYFVYKNTYEKISTLTPEASLNMCRFSGLPVAVKAKSVNKFTSGNFNVTLTLKDDTIVPLKFDTQANLITSSILCKNKTYTIQKSGLNISFQEKSN